MICFILVLHCSVQTDSKTVIFARQSNVSKSHVLCFFMAVTVISPKVHGSLPITDHEYP